MNVVSSKMFRPMVNRRSSGVALIITLILISVITFLAITFIALARRERGQVTTTLDQTTATFAADAGLERAKAELLATILANNNAFSFDLLVSTNFVNPAGFNPNLTGLSFPYYLTNVNFDYDNNGAGLTPGQFMANMTNLLFSPRVPVVVTNKGYPGSNEFRYYLDLNRDGAFTRTGWLVVTNENGGFYDLNGNPVPATPVNPNLPPPNNILVRYFTGDPQFIGILPHPEDPHSESNKFISRYAFIVLPAGKTLDVNYIHNYAKAIDPTQMRPTSGDSFRRNQGVAPWENNLGSFLVDLNTNAWPGPNQTVTPTIGSIPYVYNTNNSVPNTGAAFDDALAFLRYRYGTNSLNNLFPAGVSAATPVDQIDMYSMSPLMENLSSLLTDDDNLYSTIRPWQGSDNPNHFFSDQDFFDLTRFYNYGFDTFVKRLRAATVYSPSTYDRYTYYRMLGQLGTDSAAEPERLNLNYINIWPFYTTNYVSWESNKVSQQFLRPGSEVFFRNAADRLVKRYSEEWRNYNYRTWTNIYTYTNIFDTDQSFGASRIPVFVKGRFVYSPSLHRQLQLAANLWDGLHGTNDTKGPLPTVFRPLFTNDNGNIYINDFVEVPNFSYLAGTTNRDLANTNIAANVQRTDLLYGVPLVIGARKGLPNFNEFSAETIVQITRKAEVRRSIAGGVINETNQMLVIGISNVFGAEFWNSYTKVYQRPVEILATNFVSIGLTNDFGFVYFTNLTVGCVSNMPAWAAWKPGQTEPPSVGPWSFAVPMLTNRIIIPDLAYRHLTASFDGVTNVFERMPQPASMWFPQWVLAVTNRFVAVIKELGPNGRIIDYVQLNGLNFVRNLTQEITEDPLKFNPDTTAGLWATNSPDGVHLSDYPGLRKQIEDISMGSAKNLETIWNNNVANIPALASMYQAIANFRSFMTGIKSYTAPDGFTYTGTNSTADTVATVPFSPTVKWSIPMTWQANDPLVHYTSGDIEYIEKSGVRVPWTPPSGIHKTLVNLSRKNERYKPWDSKNTSDKLATVSVVKDPGVTKSDDWQFPTNKLPTLGWIGRLHRGTPWQTVYLKSTRVEDGGKDMRENWGKWSGNRNAYTDRNGNFPLYDYGLTQPEEDRTLLELFTTAPNENAGKGQLPVNQSGLAAWSAVLGGMVAITNNLSDQELIDNAPDLGFGVNIVDPVGVYLPNDTNTWGATLKIVEGINRTRANKTLFPQQTFAHMGDVLATPELSEQSPFLNVSGAQKLDGINDAAYEWIPQQILSLVRAGEPRFVIYSFGQTLKPAQDGIYLRGNPFNGLQAFNGMCTNYQITAETATRAVVRVVGSPDPANANNPDPNNKYPPRIVVESFNVLPPD